MDVKNTTEAASDGTQALHEEIRDLLDCSTHVLRTPLWAVSEFARMLQEESGTRLDASGLDSLAHIRSGAGRLSELMESLTRLAEICWLPVERQGVDLSALLRETTDAVQAAEPTRQARFVITPGLTAQADPVLLRRLIGILLSNAWKFTRPQPAAEIYFGWNPEGKSYFVRDNGVGFDEALAYKLFRPFQRLHASTDFEGNGMGLAMARRIIRLHGGRIWAQSRDNEGATFFFTLNNWRSKP